MSSGSAPWSTPAGCLRRRSAPPVRARPPRPRRPPRRPSNGPPAPPAGFPGRAAPRGPHPTGRPPRRRPRRGALRIPVTDQVDGDDPATVSRQGRSDLVPPLDRGRVAVQQHDRRVAVCPPVLPDIEVRPVEWQHPAATEGFGHMTVPIHSDGVDQQTGGDNGQHTHDDLDAHGAECSAEGRPPSSHFGAAISWSAQRPTNRLGASRNERPFGWISRCRRRVRTTTSGSPSSWLSTSCPPRSPTTSTARRRAARTSRSRPSSRNSRRSPSPRACGTCSCPRCPG